jgi:poly(3-hydroxyalkanoate) synthetase
MSETKIKYPPSAVKRADKKLKALLLRIIETKKGGTTTGGKKTPSRTLNEDTGELKRSVKNAGNIIEIKKGKIFIQIKVVEYYQYLDTGSKKIKNPWFLTEEFTNHKDFKEAIEELVAAGLENEIVEVLSVK